MMQISPYALTLLPRKPLAPTVSPPPPGEGATAQPAVPAPAPASPADAAPAAGTAPTPASGPATAPPAEAPASPRGLTDEQRAQLVGLAKQRPDQAWSPGHPISEARNAHLTNTFGEMARALAGDYNWLEGDVRVAGDVAVMAHDRGQVNGMTLDDWVKVAGASGRGMKLDIKEAAAIDRVVAALQAAKVDPRLLILNVTVDGPDRGSIASREQVKRLRALFPEAIINLSSSTFPYAGPVLENLVETARLVGRPVMFPLKLEFITDQVVRALKPVGLIAAWNHPLTYAPKDIPAEVRRLRAMGVDGMVDLRPAEAH